jgi:hypothetical protein
MLAAYGINAHFQSRPITVPRGLRRFRKTPWKTMVSFVFLD